MANVFAVTTGQWALTSTWNTSALPTVNDDVYSNNFTVTISAINPTVLTIRNTAAAGINAGGGFTITNGVTLSTISIVAGTVACLTHSAASPSICTAYGAASATSTGVPVVNASTGTMNFFGETYPGNSNTGQNAITNSVAGVINFVGTVYGNRNQAFTSNNNGYGIGNTTGTINVTGNVIGGNLGISPAGIGNTGSGTINIVGNLSGGSISINSPMAVFNFSTGTVNVVGNVTGGSSGANPYGISNSSTGTVNITGNVIGGVGSTGTGIQNNSTGFVYVYGTVTGGTNAVGVVNNSTGLVYATKVVGNDYGLGSVGIASIVGISNSQNGKAYVEQVEFGVRGQTPISGPVYIIPSNRNTLTGRLTALGNTVTFYNSLSVSNLLPPASSVRLGTVYNVGNSTGTMAVPSASAVQFGVAVDNTTGTAALQPQDVWGYARLSATQVNSLGDRLRNVATTQSVGQQIASFNL